jgi:hypothetical protein
MLAERLQLASTKQLGPDAVIVVDERGPFAPVTTDGRGALGLAILASLYVTHTEFVERRSGHCSRDKRFHCPLLKLI